MVSIPLIVDPPANVMWAPNHVMEWNRTWSPALFCVDRVSQPQSAFEMFYEAYRSNYYLFTRILIVIRMLALSNRRMLNQGDDWPFEVENKTHEIGKFLYVVCKDKTKLIILVCFLNNRINFANMLYRNYVQI